MAEHNTQFRDLAPNYALSVEFLRKWSSDAATCLVAIKEGVKTEAKVFVGNNAGELGTWIEDRNRQRYGIYFTVNKVRDGASHKKPKKSDIVAALGLHADIDILGDGVLDRISRFKPRPTVILMSGGGYQAYWLFGETVFDLDQVEALNKAIAKEIGGDACHNIDRLMRVPGTINWPNAKKRKQGRKPVVAELLAAETDFTRTYGLNDFQQFVIRPAILRHGHKLSTPKNLQPVEIEDLSGKLGDRLQALIMNGDDPDAPRSGPDPRHPSRSETVFAVVIGLARGGATREEIAGVLLNSKYKISESILEKPNPETYAWRQADKAVSIVDADWPDTTQGGAPKRSLANALYGLDLLGIAFEYDMFRNRIIVGGHDLQDFQGEVTDNAVAMLRKLFLDVNGFDPGKTHLVDAVQTLSLEHRLHPICDYLDVLTWDELPRLETLLIDYFGAKDTPLNRHIGKMMMVAAVRRVRSPGCKFDTMVVLEGPQGSGKSTAILILAGNDFSRTST